MKNIFIYIGSRRKTTSNTFKFINLTLNKLCKKSATPLKYEIFTPTNTSINNCEGCLNCFNSGVCFQDKLDDMEVIKNKLLNSDFIIFATPIYSNFVTADMKCFIDRLSYWTHLMILAGKPAIALTTSNGNGCEYTLNYMHTIMSHLGLDVVKKINITAFENANFSDDYFNSNADQCANLIYDYIFGVKKVKSNETLEKLFSFKNKNFLLFKDMLEQNKILKSQLPYQYFHWINNKYTNATSFQELLDNIN